MIPTYMYTILYSLNFGVKGYLSVLIQLFAINDISIGFLALRKNGRYTKKIGNQERYERTITITAE